MDGGRQVSEQLGLVFDDLEVEKDRKPPEGWTGARWVGGAYGHFEHGNDFETTTWHRVAKNGIMAGLWWAIGGYWVSRWSDNPGYAVNLDGSAAVVTHKKGGLDEALARLDQLAAAAGGWHPDQVEELRKFEARLYD